MDLPFSLPSRMKSNLVVIMVSVTKLLGCRYKPLIELPYQDEMVGKNAPVPEERLELLDEFILHPGDILYFSSVFWLWLQNFKLAVAGAISQRTKRRR